MPSNDHVIVGMCAPFLHPVPWDADGLRQFVPGCFAHVIATATQADVPLCVNHHDDETAPILARTGNRTLVLWEGEAGLYFAVPPPSARIAEHACELIARNAFVGCSIAFYPHPKRSRCVSHEDGVDSFTSVSLAEISLVPQGVAPRHPETWVRLMSPSDYHRLQATASIDVIMRHACTHFYGDQEVVLYQGVAYRLPAMLARVVVASGDASRSPYSPR